MAKRRGARMSGSSVDAGSAARLLARMHRLEKSLNLLALAAVVLMYGGASWSLIGGVWAYGSVSEQYRAHGMAGAPAAWTMVWIRNSLVGAFDFWLYLGFIWFFARYFAYVLQTRAETIRARLPLPAAAEQEQAPQS